MFCLRRLGLLFSFLCATTATAQETFDASWFDENTPYVKVGVVADGIHAITGADLQRSGVVLNQWPTQNIILLENGRPVPLLVLGGATATLAPTDTLVFVGHRNTGRGETWAYDAPASQSSDSYSLYSDTTYYWLYVGSTPGPRYAPLAPAPGAPLITAVRDTLHVEDELFDYAGDSNDSGNPLYTRGEARYHYRFNLGSATSQERVFAFPLPSLVKQAGETVSINVHLSGGSKSRHRNTLLVENTGGGTTQFAPFDEADWNEYVFQDLTATLPAADVLATLRVKVQHHNEFAANPNIVYVDFFEVAYTRALATQTGRDAFTVLPGDARLQLRGYGTGAALALAPSMGAYALGATRADSFSVSGSFAGPTKLYTARRDALLAPARVTRYQAPALAATDHEADYVILTTPLLAASAQALAAFHQATHGYQTEIVYQQDVFDQFDYGRPTPLAIRRFVYATQAWQKKPRFLTIWGDALTADPTRPLQPWEVISYGNAISDAWYGMNYHGPNDWSEVVATGRLPIRTNDEGQRFVDKMQRYRTAPSGAWQRHSLQGSGGYSQIELITLASYTRTWATISAESATAQDTTLFTKNNIDKVSSAYREEITEAFRAGTSWFTFFGHSSTQLWEIVTDPPDVMRNSPLLPVLWSFGCRTGNFSIGDAHTHTLSLAEQFVIGSEHGAIAHWGSSELSTIGAGGLLGGALHEVVFVDTMRVLGLAAQETKRRVAQIVGASSDGIKNLLQYSLVGDPGTVMRLPSQPNLHVEAAGIAFSSETPVIADSTLDVTVTLRSFGLRPPDSVTVALKHTAPNRPPATQTVRVAPFDDTARVPFTIALRDGDAGSNGFEVTVESPFGEEDLADNRATRTLPVLASGIALVTPADRGFASTTPVLRATRAALTPEPIAFSFELDTTATFSSPFKKAFDTTGVSVGAWPVSTPLDAGRTYFWRARTDEPGALWREAAFTTSPDADAAGYLAQGSLLDDADLEHIVRLDDGALVFASETIPVTLTSERGSGLYLGSISVGPETYLTLTLGWGLVLLDGATGRVKAAMSPATYKMSASLEERFGTQEDSRARLDSLVQIARKGDIVLGRSRFLGNSSGPIIEEQDKARLRALGSSAIDTLTYAYLWQMVARVGYPEQTHERVFAPGGINEVLFDSTLTFRAATGTLTSRSIGTALAWKEAGATFGTGGDAAFTFSVLDAVRDSVLRSAGGPPATIQLDDLDAAAHPRLRLRLAVTDTSAYRPGLDDAGRTPVPALTRWYAQFERAPDLLLDVADVAAPDTVQEGETLTLMARVRVLGPTEEAEEVTTELTLTDAQNRERVRQTQALGTLRGGDARALTFTVDTKGFSGTLRARFAVAQQDAEAITFNNFATRTFFVRGDATPPRYAILIDGEAFPSDPEPVRNLQDPRFPFVGARPTIEVEIEDENAFRPLADSTVFALTLNGTPIGLRSPDVRFEPAKAPSNVARIVYTPDLSGRDTTYTLVLRAFDASGNEAADSPYQVHFRVENALTVEDVLPYPNPMNTQTTFAFRVRGADAALVSECRLRIYTLTGQPVREFDLVENPALLDAGALRVGWNKLRWDGTDADGDRLATGVYLYRVFVRGADGALGSTDVERIAIIR